MFFNKTRAGPSSCSFSLLIGESFAINDFCGAFDALALKRKGVHFSSRGDTDTVERLINTLRRLGLDPLLDPKFEDVNGNFPDMHLPTWKLTPPVYAIDLAVANYIYGVYCDKKADSASPLRLKLRWQIEKNIINYFCDAIEAEEASFLGIASFAWEGKEHQITGTSIFSSDSICT